MILSGSAIQMNGFAAVFQLSRKRLMAASRSATERRTLHLKSSTAFSQERKIDGKWKWFGPSAVERRNGSMNGRTRIGAAASS